MSENELNVQPGAIEAAVCLLSGGLDSATAAAIARTEAHRLIAITFDYGQRHRFELQAANHVANAIGIDKHVVMPIDLRAFGGSALTSSAIEVPKYDESAAKPAHQTGDIPVTYVPARNTIFLSLALALAETESAYDIYLGVNAVDYSGYPDCRPAFIEAFERMANLATKVGVEGQRIRLHAPLIHLTKAQIIRKGFELGVDYALTHSCYDPDAKTGAACGKCDSCILRRKGFERAGVPDPTRYQ